MGPLLPLLALLFPPVFPQEAPVPVPAPAAEAWVVHDTEVRIPVRDGFSLAADRWLPARPGRYPTVLVQTPYDRRHFRPWFAGGEPSAGEVGRGAEQDFRILLEDRERYAFVVVDWRGFFGSKGDAGRSRRGAPRLGQDGYDVVEWIAKQPWSNGDVGTWGGSALGKVQLETAVEQPPHLRCCVPLIAALGHDRADYYEGGVMLEAHVKTLDALGFGVSGFVRANASPTAPLWRIVRRATWRPEAVQVPCLFITGWWDNFPDRILETFDAVVREGGEAARAHSRLLVGPWDHVSMGLAKQGDASFPGAAGESGRAARRFLARWLLGEGDGSGAGGGGRAGVAGVAGPAGARGAEGGVASPSTPVAGDGAGTAKGGPADLAGGDEGDGSGTARGEGSGTAAGDRSDPTTGDGGDAATGAGVDPAAGDRGDPMGGDGGDAARGAGADAAAGKGVLSNAETGTDPSQGARVRWYPAFGAGWRGADRWPGDSPEERVYTLRIDGRMVDGRPVAADEGPSKTFLLSHDPEEPVPTLGGANLPPVAHGPMRQDRLDGRHGRDLLVLTSAPLEAPLALRGRVRLEVRFRSDLRSADIAARFCVVDGDGRSFLLGDAIRRVDDIEEGTDRTADLRFPVLAADLPAGWRLRLYLGTTNWPRYERNPGTGAAHYDPATARKGAVHILDGAGLLILPYEPPTPTPTGK